MKTVFKRISSKKTIRSIWLPRKTPTAPRTKISTPLSLLKKTVAFSLYSLIPAMIALALSTLNLSILNQFTESQRDSLTIYTFYTLEGILMFLVVKGYLPQTRVNIQETVPFTEKQLAWGVSILSVLPWVWFGIDFERFQIFSNITNAILLFLVLVFFITKSWLSKRIRWGVWGAMVLPAMHLSFHTVK